MLFVGMMSNIVIHKFAIDSQFAQLRESLKVIARTTATMIDADMLAAIPLNRSGVNNPQYQIIAEKLRVIKQRNPSIHYIYIMTITDKQGIWQF